MLCMLPEAIMKKLWLFVIQLIMPEQGPSKRQTLLCH